MRNYYHILDVPNSYPKVLLPPKILESIRKVYTNNDIQNYFKLSQPILKRIPKEPIYEKVIYKPTYKYNFGSLIQFIIGITLSIALTIGFITKNDFEFWQLFPPLILFSWSMLCIKYIRERDTKIISIPLSFSEREIEKANWLNEVKRIERENEVRQLEFQTKKAEIAIATQLNFEKYKLLIHRETLIPDETYIDNPEKTKRGSSELFFLNILINEFNEQIKVDRFLNNRKYQPDFVFICNETNLHLDIEIDEPYSFENKKPIHYKGADDARNNHFLKKNWIVVRFSEKQILNQPMECIEFIKLLIKSLIEKQSKFIHNIETDNEWTYEESLIFSSNNYREKYNIKMKN